MSRLLLTAVVFIVLCPQSAPQDSETKTLRDITGIEREDEPPGTSVAPWLFGVVLGALLVVALLLRKRTRRRTALSAEQWAKHELARIASLDLGAKGKANRHYLLVSNVLRGYIEKRFNIPARRQTTREFLEGVLHEPRIPAEHWKTLEQLLSLCDLGKFAGAQPSPEQCQTLAAGVVAFIESVSGK